MSDKKKISKRDIAKVEAVLFAASKIVSIEELVRLTHLKEDEVKETINELKKKFRTEESPLTIVEFKNSYKLTLKDEYLPLAEEVVKEVELPKSVLETLAIIAFKHPIQQNELVKIRSNKAYSHLDKLEELGFIKRTKVGRTKKIDLTQKFYEYFDIPPSKIKDAFATYEPVERKIEEKEVELEKIKEELKIREESKENNEQGIDIDVKVYRLPEEEREEKDNKKEIPKVEVVDEGEKIGGLLVVGEEVKEEKKEEKKSKETPKKDLGKTIVKAYKELNNLNPDEELFDVFDEVDDKDKNNIVKKTANKEEDKEELNKNTDKETQDYLNHPTKSYNNMNNIKENSDETLEDEKDEEEKIIEKKIDEIADSLLNGKKTDNDIKEDSNLDSIKEEIEEQRKKVL